MLKSSRLLGAIWTTLWKNQNGQDVVLEDGTEIKAADYISAPRPGKIITILGDTRKTMLVCVWLSMPMSLVHESTYGKGWEDCPQPRSLNQYAGSNKWQQKQVLNASCSIISVPVSSQRYQSAQERCGNCFWKCPVVKDLKKWKSKRLKKDKYANNSHYRC